MVASVLKSTLKNTPCCDRKLTGESVEDSTTFLHDTGFDKGLLAIDVDALVTVRDTKHIEEEWNQLKEIVVTLANSHTMIPSSLH